MTEEALPNPHDGFVRFAFSDVNETQSFLAKTLPSEILATLNLSTLETVPGTFVDSALRQRHSDLLFRVSLRNGDEGFVYILFEHKNYQDPMLPFQLLRYMVRIWERQSRDAVPLSPIIPLILYHGQNAWSTSRTMQEILKAPSELARFVPQFDSVLIDLSQCSDEELRGNALFNAVLLVLKYIASHELQWRLSGIIQLFVQIIDGPRGLECLKAVLVYLSNATDKISHEQLTTSLQQAFRSIKTERDSPMPTIAETLIQQGMEKGLRAGIRVVIDLRFPDDGNRLLTQTNNVHSAELLMEFLELCKTASSQDELQSFLDRACRI